MAPVTILVSLGRHLAGFRADGPFNRSGTNRSMLLLHSLVMLHLYPKRAVSFDRQQLPWGMSLMKNGRAKTTMKAG